MKKGLIAILITANLLMLVIGILTIPPNLRLIMEKEPSEPRAEQEASVAPSPEEKTNPTATESSSIPAPKETTMSLSTEERPDLGHFIWYTEDVVYNGVPSDVNIIDNIGPLIGGWKALIIYDPDNKHNSSAIEFLNVAITGTAENLSLKLDWYQIFWADAGESIDETEMEDSVFNGKWENGGLWASGPGTIRLTKFYEQNGNQYAVGTIDTPDGIPANIALVRP